jgi:hypothetical protein
MTVLDYDGLAQRRTDKDKLMPHDRPLAAPAVFLVAASCCAAALPAVIATPQAIP